MKVVLVSKALVVAAYHGKLEEMAREPDIELTAIVPPSWREPSAPLTLERVQGQRYRLIVSPIAFNGHFHLFFFPQLASLLDQLRPDLLHVDEEPYNLATFLGVLEASRRRIPTLFFTWQNLDRRYPPPFSWIERYTYRRAAWAIAGTEAAERVLRAKGYQGSISVIPQFGIDPETFCPMENGDAGPIPPQDRGGFTVGYVGRLVPAKGVGLLIDALVRLPTDFQLRIVGDGPARTQLQARAGALGLSNRVEFVGLVPSVRMPETLRRMDGVVLPSLSQSQWTEQFGRVLVEAMACGVPVIGSTCGEIPEVVGDAGLLFPEGDVDALAESIRRLAEDRSLYAELAGRGRHRVLERFTHARIAQNTVPLYRSILAR